jgi:RNA polymerase primary sigma factor
MMTRFQWIILLVASMFEKGSGFQPAQGSRPLSRIPGAAAAPEAASVKSRYKSPVVNAKETYKGRASVGISRAQEITYSRQIRTLRAALALKEQLQITSHSKWAQSLGLSSATELRKILQDGQRARQELVAANVGLVTSVARRYSHALNNALNRCTILTLQDMIQEGTLGLMEAAERFEPGMCVEIGLAFWVDVAVAIIVFPNTNLSFNTTEKGAKFSTYATYWVRQRILQSISDSSRTIRLPAHVHASLNKLYKVKRRLSHELGREPSISELALELGESVDKVKHNLQRSRIVTSLELPLRRRHDDATTTIGDSLASDSPAPEDTVQNEFLKRDLHKLMETELTDSERQVLTVRFGLRDGTSRRLTETAQVLGITRDRVRLMEARALNKLRSPQRNYRLKEYMDDFSTRSSIQVKKVAVDIFPMSLIETSRTTRNTKTVSVNNEAAGSMAGSVGDRMWFF